MNITIGNRNGMPGMMHLAAVCAGIENMTSSLCTEWIEINFWNNLHGFWIQELRSCSSVLFREGQEITTGKATGIG